MKNDLVFASANANKVIEVSGKLGGIKLLSLRDINCLEEIPETADTLEGNAQLKARYVYEKFGYNCFADDTGLEIKGLQGRPGVLSARYAGSEKDEAANRKKVLMDMKDQLDRSARFRTVICLIINGQETLIEGIVEGHIERNERGQGGFGYDALFTPLGSSRTFAQMSIEEKNIISHRGSAISKLKKILG